MSLLKEPIFIGMCLSVTLMSTGCPYMLYFLPAYAISAGNYQFSIFSRFVQTTETISKTSLTKRISIWLGFTKSEAGFLVTVSAAVDLVGRLGFGYLSDLEIFDRKKAYVIW